MSDGDVVKVQCQECGGGFKNHKVLKEYVDSWSNDEDGEHGSQHYQVVKCQGCDGVRFRVESWDTFDVDPRTGAPETSVKVYPEFMVNSRTAMIDSLLSDLPVNVDLIYRETVNALNAGTMILAGAGLRAIVEAICKDKGLVKGSLQEKVDGLVKQGMLAKPQADLLHEERYLGNAAVHEIEAPARKDIEDGLQIVEALLNTIYVVPVSADRLRKKRMKKAAEKKAP